MVEKKLGWNNRTVEERQNWRVAMCLALASHFMPKSLKKSPRERELTELKVIIGITKGYCGICRRGHGQAQGAEKCKKA